MAKAIFAGKEVKELSGQYRRAVFGTLDTPFPRFAEYFLVRHRPRNTGNGNREYKKPYEL